jgi:hypothetical protein
MNRHVLMYGLIGGILIAALKWTEYQFRFPKVPVPSGHKFRLSVEGEDAFVKV